MVPGSGICVPDVLYFFEFCSSSVENLIFRAESKEGILLPCRFPRGSVGLAQRLVAESPLRGLLLWKHFSPRLVELELELERASFRV